MNEESPRYTVDRVGDLEWSIFDTQLKGDPTIYLMYVVPIAGPHFNYQVILTVYDGVQASLTDYPELPRELYSTFFYSIEGKLEDFFDSVVDALQRTEIENPIELCHYYGGTVLSGTIRTAPVPIHH